MAIRVLIADDHSLFRQGLRKLLEMEEDISVVGEANDGIQAEELAAKLQPDVILMDIKMPVKNGSAAAEAILKERPEIGIVILTMYDGEEHLQKALKAGARSYLLKTANSRDVIAAVRAVHSGQSMIDTNMTAKLVDQVRRMNEGSPSDGPGLTEKETAVLKLLGTGFSNKQIARELNYSESTVKNRLSIIFEKIGVQDRTQAAIFAVRTGLLKLDEDD